MQWENLTAPEFKKAVERTGVCLIAVGVVEKHSEHLPLGTDYLNGHKIACLAAEKEPAVVWPPFYFGQIYEAACFPGVITVKPTLLLELFQEVFDAIGRNGFKKIIVYNAHGGNFHFLPFLAQCQLWQQKPYSLYLLTDLLNDKRKKIWQETCETKEHGHACECETSVTLANYPDLVRMDQVPKAAATALKRTKAIGPTFTGIWWYSDFPDHYAGDARSASKEKGRILRDLLVDSVAEFIAAVKADQVIPHLEGEFFRKSQRIASRRTKASSRRPKGRA